MSDPSQPPVSLADAWKPLMCPSCRGLFRAPAQARGETECPLCSSRIRVAAPQKTAATAPEDQALVKRRRTVSNQAPQKTNTWDETGDSKAEKSRGSGSLIVTFLFFISLGVVAGAYFMFKDRFNGSTGSAQADAKVQQGLSQFGTGSGNGQNSSRLKPEKLLQVDDNDIQTAKEAAVGFLNSQNLEEMVPLIRDRERVEPLMRAYYRDNPFEPSQANTVDGGGRAQVLDRFISFPVIFKDYTARPIAVEMTATGPLVDWESWVGYCEVPWEAFIADQLQEPTVMRVNVRKDYYYNFNFADAEKWTCYRLSRGTDDTVISGYLPADSPLNQKLANSETKSATFVIQIRFPDNPASKDQVLILDVLQDGWVLGL